MTFLQDCYHHCMENHVMCDTTTATLPKRVLEIIGPSLRLVEPHEQTQNAYAALSYTWGNLACQIATSKTLQDLKRGISWNSLPAVFANAITIARKLGLEYIWIDTVCILQDDPLDWEIEASRMAEIFSNASVVLVASSSLDPKHSFLTEHGSEFRSTTFRLDGRPSQAYRARRQVPLGIHAKAISPKFSDHIDLRVWTLQELELSTRSILFTRAEVQWRCNECRSCECRTTSQAQMSIGTPSPDACIDRLNAHAYYEWHMTAEQYSMRKLTYAKDKLPALMGLAQRFHRLNGTTYMAGLWKENLLVDLAWRRQPKGVFRPAPQYLAPTFSWVSVFTAVDYQPVRHLYPGKRRYSTEVTTARCNLEGVSIFGQITAGSVTLRGPTIWATLRCATPLEAQTYVLIINGVAHRPRIGKTASCEFSIDSPLHIYQVQQSGSDDNEKSLDRCTEEVGEPIEDVSVKLLILFSIHSATRFYENFLILARSSKYPGVYVRVGMGTGKLYTENGSDEIIGKMGPFDWIKKTGDASDISGFDLLPQDCISIV